MPVSANVRERLVFLDLDDTLIATFEQIIKWQETSAARALAAFISDSESPWDGATLAARLLDLRRRDPDEVERWLVSLGPGTGDELLSLRRDAMAKTPLAGLRLAVGMRRLLAALSARYRLVLLTEGCPQFQRRKIDRLGLARFFERIEIVDGVSKSKTDVLKLWISRDRDGRNAVVVGNRLDREIAAGHRLGLATIWVRRGEGAGRVPRRGDPRPTRTIRDIAQLPAALRRRPFRL